MADNTVKEDRALNNSKVLTNKQPVLVDIGSVQSKNLKLVTFNPIGELISLDENLTLRYRISKSFHPKSGDWIGLFQVGHNADDKYVYIGFHWAQKHPYEKKKLLERLVHFRINEFNIPINCGKDTYYQFLYMTGSEKLVGCSNMFGIRIYLPLVRKPNATSERTSAVTQGTIACVQQMAIVPYEFFHQQYAQLLVENVVIHLCYEDLTARRCVLDPIKYPVSHRYAGCQGLKGWSRLSYSPLSSHSPSNSCTGCQQSKDVIRSLKRRILMLRTPAKQREVESLKNEVNRLKQRVLSLEEALAEECSAKSDLIRLNHQVEQEMMRKLKGMTTWLMEKRTIMWQNQHQCSFISTGQHGKDQVHIHQSCKPRLNPASPHVDLDKPSIGEKSVNKTSEVTRNEDEQSQDLAGRFQSTLKKKKASLNQNTYSGSRIGLRYLFKESLPKKEQTSVDESYSGSNLSLRVLFNEPIPEKERKEPHSVNVNRYSGSNLSLRHLFDDRCYERRAKKQATSSNTYSGSNLAFSHLFREEDEDAAMNFKATTENSSCAKCFCQHKVLLAEEQRTGGESTQLKEDNVVEGFKRKTEKTVQINSKKHCVYFRNDNDEQEEPEVNDMTTESNPETGSNYLVEIKDNHLVQVTGQARVPQDSKSAPVSDTAGIEAAKAPIAIPCYPTAKPKPEPRKKSNRSPGINKSTQLTTKQADEDKMDAAIQVDGLLYSGGVYWVSSEFPGLEKAAPPISSMSCQATTGVIPPTKSLTVSAVAATDGKQDMSKESAILTTQADISRDAKSAYSLGKTGINSHGNETSITSNPTITSTNCRPAANKNLVTGSGVQGTNHMPTMVGTIQNIEMTDIAPTSQLTVIKDVNIISIPTSTDAAATQALHVLEKVNTDPNVTPPIVSGPEENKKRKRYSATGSSALSKSKNTDDSASAVPNKNNKIPKNACLASGSEFSNFTYTVKARLPKSPTMPLVPDDSARSSTLVQAVKAQCPPLATSQHGTTGTSGTIQSTKSESKTLPLMSAHSTGAGSRTSTQIKKVLPPPSCPLLPPHQERLQPAFLPDPSDDYPPLRSALPNSEIKPSVGHDDTSYASVTRGNKKPMSKPDTVVCSLHTLAKLAKDIIKKCCKSDDEMKEPAITKDISPPGQNQHQKMLDKGSEENEQKSLQEDIVEQRRQGQTTEDLSAPKQDCLKTIKLSNIIKESLTEESDHSSTTKDSLDSNQTPLNKVPSKTDLTATVQQDDDSLKTSLTAASAEQDSLTTKIQEFIKIEDAQTRRQDKQNKVTMKRGLKDSAQKDPATNKRQRSKKADLNLTKQNNFNSGPTGGHGSVKKTPAQSTLQREKTQDEFVKTDQNPATTIDSPTPDTNQNPPLTDARPDSQNPPSTDQSSPAVQNANQTPPKKQETDEKSPANTSAKPKPEDSRSRLSKHLASLEQDDQSRRT